MANLQDYLFGTLTVALLLSWGFAVSPDDTHFCRARELSFYCHDVSDSGKTCYTKPFLQGKRICYEGWESILKDFPTATIDKDLIVKITANNGLYECQGKDLYSKCIKDDGKEAYFGELT